MSFDSLDSLPGATGELGTELLAAIGLARAAGDLVLKYHRGDELGVELKAGDEPVTVADKLASELIVEGLGKRFSDPIVSEELALAEGVLQSSQAGRLWLVDPIDGTKDFIRGSDGFSVMIGLLRAGRPVLGVVHQPAVDPPHGRIFIATPDGGAHVVTSKGVAALRVSNVAAASEARLVASASHRGPDIDKVKSALGIDDEQNVGSVGVKLCLIALGLRDLYVNPAAKTKVWDTCAPEAILAGAGGRLSDLFGTPVDYTELRQRRGLVASNGHVHQEVVDKLGPLFKKKS
ncbi:MAG TPA: inositol monophosphatase family protein [Kofleriaceae bacterium]|nr:inositol monophosphatase family protein [Kofleriaceae bacterium]